MKEQDLQSKIQAYLRYKGCYVIKTIVTNRAGVPDIIACCEGQFYGIEVKLSTNKPSELQKAHLRQIVEAKGKAIVAYSLNDVKQLLEGSHD
jgi:Holliday junction resolvase